MRRDSRPTARWARDLSPWWWLGVPGLLLAAQFGTYAADGGGAVYQLLFEDESGIVENATALLSLAAAVLAALATRYAWRAGRRGLPALLVVFALGCVFYAGEEVSWGQQYFNWQSPEYFIENNVQGETNLHNMAGFKKKTLREIILGGMLLGGVLAVLSLLLRVRWRRNWGWFVWLVPTRVCVATTVVAVAFYWVVRHYAQQGLETEDLFDFEMREVVELYIAVFFFVYAASLACRLRQVRGPDVPDVIGP
jgi:hypothetical protein